MCGTDCNSCTCITTTGELCGGLIRVGNIPCEEQPLGCPMNELCGSFVSADEEVNVTCRSAVNGRYAQLILLGDSRIVSLREMELYGAQGPEQMFPKMARLGWNTTISDGTAPAENCMDGIHDDDANICHGTVDWSPWLQIDFGSTVTVHSFTVHNRRDADCNYRLAGGSQDGSAATANWTSESQPTCSGGALALSETRPAHDWVGGWMRYTPRVPRKFRKS